MLYQIIYCKIVEYFPRSWPLSFAFLKTFASCLYNSIFIFWISSVFWTAFAISVENVWSTHAVTSYFYTIIGCSGPNCIIFGIELSMWCSYDDITRSSTARVSGFLRNELISIPSIIHRVQEISQRSSILIHGTMENCVTTTITTYRKLRTFAATVCG